jgi:flavorubredoxin
MCEVKSIEGRTIYVKKNVSVRNEQCFLIFLIYLIANALDNNHCALIAQLCRQIPKLKFQIPKPVVRIFLARNEA